VSRNAAPIPILPPGCKEDRLTLTNSFCEQEIMELNAYYQLITDLRDRAAALRGFL
jgi:hypothetical protein